MPKIVWVLLPLLLYALYLLVQLARQRAPGRFTLNVHTSLLLMFYLLGTSGLGIFWVANQQLPVFDWHYLFGYCTLLLVTIHLVFNLPMVWHWLRRKAGPFPARPGKSASAGTLAKGSLIVFALGAAFLLGTRQGGLQTTLPWQSQTPNQAQDPAASGSNDVVVAYHEFSSESQGSVFRRAPGIDWGDAPGEFKQYPNAQRIALPKTSQQTGSFSAALQTPVPRQQALRLAELGEMLHLGSGITARRGGHHYRAAPSSGALFPSELYLLVRQVEGLNPGLYHYDPQFHQLALIDAAITHASDIGAPEAEAADLVLVLGSLFRRTGYKYRDRAYRYAAADGGHLLENLRLAGNAAGLQGHFLPRFDDARVASALRLDPAEEGVLAVLAWHSKTAPAPVLPHRYQRRVMANTNANPAALGVTGIMQQASSLELITLRKEAGDIVLPAPNPAATALYQTITQRRSQRRYSEQAVPLPALSALLADVAQAPQLSDALSLHLVINRVDGLPPGVYRYLPQHTLKRVRAGKFAAKARNTALEQDVIGEAAVVLIITASRPTILQDGARGYRHALLETGLLGERWLLSAVARGLAACPVGAFYDDQAAALLELDPQQHWVLHFAALGLPAS